MGPNWVVEERGVKHQLRHNPERAVPKPSGHEAAVQRRRWQSNREGMRRWLCHAAGWRKLAKGSCWDYMEARRSRSVPGEEVIECWVNWFGP